MTIVEVMVASVVLGMVVSATTVMIGNSDFMRLNGDHYRQARIISQEELEDPSRHFLNFGTIANLNQSIVLDYNEGATRSPITANRLVSVSSSQQKLPGDANNIDVPYKLVSSEVNWSEGGRTHRVTLYKRVVQVKP